MIYEAISHTGTFPDIYLNDRKTLTITVRTAKKDIDKCILHYFARTAPLNEKQEVMKCVFRSSLFDYYRVEIVFSQIARYQKYYFEINGDEHCFYSSWGISKVKPTDGFFEYLYANTTDVLRVPEWSRGQVFYQIFPERYCNGDKSNDPKKCDEWGSVPTRENYMGGDIAGIIKKLPYIYGLGIDCIYLNPIFMADFNHKYATTDYYDIDPIFGSKKDLLELTTKAHEHGIRIVLDGVFNHTGTNFKPFQDVLNKQEKSRYCNWFHITEYPFDITHHGYECVGAYKYMPKLNTGNPEVRNYIIDVMDYWVREFHIDGWRLDVSDEVDEGVWTQARLVLKQKYPDILLLGETWGSGLRLMNGSQMDSIMNYVFRDAVRDFIATNSIDASEFNDRIQKMLADYPIEMDESMYLPLDSHDTQRFLFLCDEDKRKMRLAVMLQMCFIGSPAVYYGDEIGMTGDNDPDCRRCMEWKQCIQDIELYELYQKLIKIRHTMKSIRYGSYTVNLCEGRLYGFVRKCGEECVYVVVNSGNEHETVDLPVFSNTCYMNLLGSEKYHTTEITKQRCYDNDINDYQGILKLVLQPYEAKIIKGGKNENE